MISPSDQTSVARTRPTIPHGQERAALAAQGRGCRRVRGRYLGASNSLYGLGCSIGPVVGILLWNRMGDAMWLLCGAVGLVRRGGRLDRCPAHLRFESTGN